MFHPKHSLIHGFICGIFLLSSAFAIADSSGGGSPDPQIVANYMYPDLHPYLATLTAELAPVDNFSMKSRDYVLLPARKKIPFIGGRNKLTVNYILQTKQPAPVAFVVAGLGGSSSAHIAKILASYYFQGGYSVITLPNPFSWNFLLSASRSGFVGYAPDDAKELYDFMKTVTGDLSSVKHMQPKGFVVGGYSMGALESAFLAHIDGEEHTFNFKNVLLIDPPIDLAYGINTLDRFYLEGSKLSAARRSWMMNVVINIAEQGQLTLDMVAPIVKKFGFGTLDFEWILGEAFHSSLTDVILASQQVNDRAILKTPQAAMSMREVEAQKYDFIDYLNQFYIPFAAPNADVNSLLNDGSLETLWAELGQNPNVEFMDNADDFLLKPGDVEKIFANFGERAVIYPRGGHVGNIWFADNRRWILARVALDKVFQ